MNPRKFFGLPLSSTNFFVPAMAALLASGGAEARTVGPFSTTLMITEMVHPVGTFPCSLVGDISGKGAITKPALGNVTATSQDCINPISATEFSFLSTQLVLTVNGGKINVAYGGILSATTGLITGGFLIIGGTGHFSKATGAGTMQGLEQIDLAAGTGAGEVTLTGTISY